MKRYNVYFLHVHFLYMYLPVLLPNILSKQIIIRFRITYFLFVFPPPCFSFIKTSKSMILTNEYEKSVPLPKILL